MLFPGHEYFCDNHIMHPPYDHIPIKTRTGYGAHVQTGNRILDLWNRLSRLPGGRWLFCRVVQHKAPYFRTIPVSIEELGPNYARLKIKKCRSIENHIGTVHVIAICNLLEMAMGVVAEVSVPAHLRWIPKGMSLEYTAKAGSNLVGIASIDSGAWKPGDLEVRVQALDAHGTPVVQGVISLWISEKPAAIRES